MTPHPESEIPTQLLASKSCFLMKQEAAGGYVASGCWSATAGGWGAVSSFFLASWILPLETALSRSPGSIFVLLAPLRSHPLIRPDSRVLVSSCVVEPCSLEAVRVHGGVLAGHIAPCCSGIPGPSLLGAAPRGSQSPQVCSRARAGFQHQLMCG